MTRTDNPLLTDGLYLLEQQRKQNKIAHNQNL